MKIALQCKTINFYRRKFMMRYLSLILLCVLFISCSKKEEVEFVDVDVYLTHYLSEDLDYISNITTKFNTPLSSGDFREIRGDNQYDVEIKGIKCPADIDVSVIFERNDEIEISGELGLKKSRNYKIVRNFSDGSSLPFMTFTVDTGGIPTYDLDEINDFFESEGEYRFVLHLDEEGNQK